MLNYFLIDQLSATVISLEEKKDVSWHHLVMFSCHVHKIQAYIDIQHKSIKYDAWWELLF